METLPDCCLPLAQILTTTQQMSADEYHRRVSFYFEKYSFFVEFK
jgi:hypothetical protein